MTTVALRRDADYADAVAPIRYIGGKTMRQKLLLASVCSAVVIGLAPPAHAQSLADVAKKEGDRRKTIPQPAKVYTNKDLKPVPPPSAPPPEAGAAPAPPADAKAAEKPAPEADRDAASKGAASDKSLVKDQAYWARQLKGLQDALDRDQTYADAVQTRIDALTTDFVNRDDPAQRAVIERDRQKNIAELNRLKLAIQTDKKALADFVEEARRAGVPPGWVR
jgi:hypothetical protein